MGGASISLPRPSLVSLDTCFSTGSFISGNYKPLLKFKSDSICGPVVRWINLFVTAQTRRQ